MSLYISFIQYQCQHTSKKQKQNSKDRFLSFDTFSAPMEEDIEVDVDTIEPIQAFVSRFVSEIFENILSLLLHFFICSVCYVLSILYFIIENSEKNKKRQAENKSYFLTFLRYTLMVIMMS